jgi:circadian clock protein KaiC
MFILKSRGMAHSNQIREFVLTDKGVDLLDVYVGPSGVLTGSARLSREAQEKAKDLVRQQDAQIQQLSLEKKRKAMEARIADMRAEFKTEEAEVRKSIKQEKLRQQKVSQDRETKARIRKAD